MFTVSGTAACFLALFLTLGVHWHLLQSVAWARMLADYSRTNSWSDAIERTFDGKHPCPMCVEIRDGRQQEERNRQETPWVSVERTLDMLFEHRAAIVPQAPSAATTAVPFVPRGCDDFAASPPKPPPRVIAV